MYFIRDPKYRTLDFSEFDAEKFKRALDEGMEIVEETEDGRRKLSYEEIEEADRGNV